MKRVYFLAAAALVLASPSMRAQDKSASADLEIQFKKGTSLQIDGSMAGVPDEAIVDIAVERFMNHATHVNPILDQVRADLPPRQYAEVAKGKFRAIFPSQVVGYYYIRIEFLIKFQRSNKVGKALMEGKLKESVSEKLVFLGTTEDLIESIRLSIPPVENIAKALNNVLASAGDPKTDQMTLSGKCDRISDDIDRIQPTNALAGTLHALKCHAEAMATIFRGTARKKSGDPGTPGFGGGVAPPKGGQPQGTGQAQGQGAPNEEGTGTLGNESPFLKPSEDKLNQQGIKLGDRFGPAKDSTKEQKGNDSDPIEKTKNRLENIQKLYSREIAVILLERAKEQIAALRSADLKSADSAKIGADLTKLAECHASRAVGTDPVATTYVEVTTVQNIPMAKFWEKVSLFLGDKRPAPGQDLDNLNKEIDDLWTKFNGEIRNRTR